MIDGVITVAGKELPYRRTLGACKKFDARFKPDMTIFKLGAGSFDIEHLIYVVFVFVEAGFKVDGGAVPEWFTEQWLEDNATMDEMAVLVETMSGKPQADAEPAKKKPAYKGGE